MKSHRLRSGLVTGAVVLAAGAFWLFLAPAKVGGRSTYVMTSGTSMEPAFHTGDLAIVRPVARYRVGMIVAYHSSLLKVVVLHRIIAIHGDRYVFKGDHNNFVDPTQPTRSELIGALWMHIPHGSVVFSWLHSPVMAAALCAVVALVLIGRGETRRRRDRRRNRGHATSRQGASPVIAPDRGASLGVSVRTLLIGVATVAVACAAVALYAATRPAAKGVSHRVTYTQKGHITYHATAPAGPVYPGGIVSTGDPIFLQLVHRLAIDVSYRFAVDAPLHLHGTQQVLLQLTGPTGWKRQMPLSPVRHFTGAGIATPATIDLRAVQALLDEVQKATGVSAEGASVGVAMKVHVAGTVAGQPVDASFTPTANFALQPLELTPGGSPPPSAAGTGSGSATSTQSGFTPSAQGSMTSVTSEPNTFSLAGQALPYSTIAWLAVAGAFAAGGVAILLAILLRRNQAFDEAARIRARYGHMLVPILIGEDLGWPPVDVGSFKALVRLAEAAGQVILHHQADAVDTYLVNDNGTVYRYQISLPQVTWGEWTETQVGVDPAALSQTATALADAAATAAEAKR